MRFAAFKDLTRLEQTFFGLPFILSAALLNGIDRLDTKALLWVLLAFMLARISGMSFNQLIDREIDLRNPRTKDRPLPSGRVSIKQARIVAWGALFFFLLVCLKMNILTAALSLLAAPLLYLYSYMKKLHSSAHFVLGSIHFLGVIMTFSAMTGSLNLAVIFLGASAAFLIIGTDIAYAIQDYSFDSKEGLFSIPTCLGIDKSLKFSILMHMVCLMMLIAVGLCAQLPYIYYFLIPLVGSIFWSFHRHLSQKLEKSAIISLESLFFLCNVSVSISILLFMVFARLWTVIS